MKPIIVLSSFAFSLFLIYSCGNSAELNKISAEMVLDSARLADSMKVIQERLDSAEKLLEVDPATFNFEGKWEGNIMTVEIKGDSGMFNMGKPGTWFKAEYDRSANPVGFDLLKNFKLHGEKQYAFRAILEIIDQNTMKICFANDLTAKPTTTKDEANNVLLKRK